MDSPKSRADVAVFIDFENVYVSVREKFDAQPNFELIMDRCEDFGRIVIARAYADWYRYPRVTSALFANGVEPMYVPTYYYDREVGRTGRPIKNSVDIHLCIDAMRTLYTQTHIDKFVLVTGDRDFIPLVNAIRQHGKDVIIIGIGGAASAHLAQAGDEFLFYEQIADLKPQRQEQPSKAERRDRDRERDKPERAERSESNGRGEGRRERDRDRDKAERAAASQAASAPEQPQAEPEQPVAPERTVFDTLVDAINLARQRGFVCNLGSLKVLMRELDSDFNESKVRDSHGKPFSKFKDFVKEGERLGKVQVFTNGTVTEVFLPGEDPMRVSQFAEDLAQQQEDLDADMAHANGKAESVLDDEHAIVATPQFDEPAVEEEAPVAEQMLIDEATPISDVVAEEPAEEPVSASDASPTRQTFGDREWETFVGSMSQFNDPVRFADIFSALRGLRNQEVLDLTNNEIKELVKQAINRGMLQRTGRGARAYYRLNSQYRVAQNDTFDTTVTAESVATDDEISGSPVGLVSDSGQAPAARTRRGRAYSLSQTSSAAEAAPATTETSEPVQEVISEHVAVQSAEVAPAKPRRNRRRKTTAEAEAPAEAQAPAAEAAPEPVPEAEAGDAKANGTKKRRTRRKKKTDETPETPGDVEQE